MGGYFIENPKLNIKTPLLLVLYNRPELTNQLFEVLKSIGEFEQLYISIDGPRGMSDQIRVDKVRNLCRELDLGGHIHVKQSEFNQGCRLGVSSALNWFFSHVDKGIILEDDCHPSSEFFHFMETMLDKYQDDTRVAQISGYNTLNIYPVASDYIYSNFGNIWGWGTWRRAWDFYDLEMKTFSTPNLSSNLRSKIHFTFDGLYRMKNFRDVYVGKIDTWDYQWIYTRLVQNQVCVIPKVSLVKNVGIGDDATHTFQPIKTLDDSHLATIRKNIDWSVAIGPKIMLPDYQFELSVATSKRGWRGFGLFTMSIKGVKKIVRLIGNWLTAIFKHN